MTERLFHLFTTAGAEWVMILLVALSVLSIAVTLERLVFFVRNGGARAPELNALLRAGKLDEAWIRVARSPGLEADVARAALAAAPGGSRSVAEAVAGAIAEGRPGFERGLSFLGTLGNNAPFLGLFGTVVGIIQAFSDLSVGTAKGAAAAAVMGGISEALVATAVGILVAIPAVVAFNGYGRWLRAIVGRAETIGHAVATHLERDDVRGAACGERHDGAAA
jgi:biopolymer transport protein ExbB/TolQ